MSRVNEAEEALKKRKREAEDRREECKRKKNEASDKGIILCRYCGFTGMITAKKGVLTEELKKKYDISPGLDTRELFCFRCNNCVAAEQMGLTERFPVWTKEYSDQYDIS